ncbi:MAG: hypothetical protein Q8N81_06890, partial [bacterium]|nr:hypothetical protein [bacterium]
PYANMPLSKRPCFHSVILVPPKGRGNPVVYGINIGRKLLDSTFQKKGTAMKRPEKKSTRIQWEYCECGCHGYELQLGHAYYWMFNDLGEGGSSKPFHLHTGHSGLGEHIGSFSSFKAADRAARERAKGVLKKRRTELERAKAGVR